MTVSAGEGGAARESPLRGRVLPWAVVALLLVGTMLAVALILAQERRQSRDDREDVASQTLERLEAAVDAQVLGLRGVAATAAAEPLSNAGFARISEAPLSAGLDAVSWLPRVEPSQREAVERAAGAPIVQPDGAGGLRTAGDRRIYYPAALIARAEGPGTAPRVGLDHWSIAERRRAMSAAMASGEVRGTGETTVDGVGSGMLVYVPVTGDGGAPVGFVAGSLSAAELQALANRNAPDGADVDVVLGPGAAEGAAGAKGVAVGDIAGTPVRVIVGGLGASLWLPLIILVTGLAVAALVAALFVLAAAREREGRRAAEMVARERDYSEAIVSSIQDGLMVLDENLRVRSVNVRFEEITGFRENELVGKGPPFPFLSAPESDRLGDIVEEVRVLGVGEFDLGLVDRDGEEIPAILSLSASVAGSGSLVGFVGTVKDITARKRTEQRLRDREAENRALAAQHEAIRTVATAVAREKDPEEVFALIARQALAISGGDVGGVARAPESRSGEVVAWRAHGSGPVTEQVQLTGEDEPIAVALRDRDRAMGGIDALRVGRETQGGARAAIAAPIRAGGSLWGVVFAETADPGRMTREVEEGIESLAELAALAIMNDDARRRLESQATTDPLTGLANRRAFDDRLRLEVVRAERHSRPLSLVLLDLDHFKMVNDAHGHQLGDKVLVETANRLTQLARVGDLVARIGGEEFAWILTETDGAGAEVAAERARRIVRDEPFAGVGSLTISLGACSLDIGGDAESLLRFADTALYHAKERGRDRVHLYVPSDGTDAPLAASRSSIARARAQDGLRSLVRGIEETSDPRALPRSDRVAELAAAIGSDLGWEATRVVRLREAALLHDIGWVAVPPDVRARRGPLTTDQRLVIRDHVEHGAMIAAGVLDDEQISWIRFHHERWDGRGYPDGLVGEEIPDGARIIAVADAWVAMTSPREYRPTLSGARALEEFRAEASAQFAPEPVDALERVMASADSGVTSVRT